LKSLVVGRVTKPGDMAECRDAVAPIDRSSQELQKTKFRGIEGQEGPKSLMFERYFTPQEAEDLIPTVERATESIRTAKRVLDACDEEFSTLAKKINTQGGTLVDLDAWSSKRLLREAAGSTLAEEIQKLQDLGVQLKDFELGLVDYPTLLGEEEVLLCWKLGEAQIQFWHRTTEGYANRRPLIAGAPPPSSKGDKSVQ
jgi:hypothetical protein